MWRLNTPVPPHHKEDIIKCLIRKHPEWKMTELRKLKKKQLYAIFYKIYGHSYYNMMRI